MAALIYIGIYKFNLNNHWLITTKIIKSKFMSIYRVQSLGFLTILITITRNPACNNHEIRPRRSKSWFYIEFWAIVRISRSKHVTSATEAAASFNEMELEAEAKGNGRRRVGTRETNTVTTGPTRWISNFVRSITLKNPN